MDHPALVGMRQRLGRLEAPTGNILGRQGLIRTLTLVEDVGQAAALDELHGVIMDAPLGADGEDRHDVRVMQPGDRLGLATEPLHGLLVGDGPEPQDLERHTTAERRLLGLIDDAHAAASELADDPEIAQGRWPLGRRARGASDELDAREASVELIGQLGMSGKELVAIRGRSGLEIGHVSIQDLDDLRGRVGQRSHFWLMRIGAIGLVEGGVIGLGHIVRSPAVLCEGRRTTIGSPSSIGPESARMSRNPIPSFLYIVNFLYFAFDLPAVGGQVRQEDTPGRR